MRQFTKNLLNFSWAVSLFGARQLGRVLDPRQTLQGAPDASRALRSVTDTVRQQLGTNLGRTFDAGEKIQGEIVDAMFGFLAPAVGPARAKSSCAASMPPIFNARSQAGESVLITWSRGQGRFSKNRQEIAIETRIYELDGRENGVHQSVWAASFKSPAELFARPAPPVGPMDQPVGPVPSFPIQANTIARWTHADGSSISSVGPQGAHVIPLSDGSSLYVIVTAQIITEGTGRFHNARGLSQSIAATHIPAGQNLFSPQGPATFPAATLDTFKLLTIAAPQPATSSPPTSPSPSPSSKARDKARGSSSAPSNLAPSLWPSQLPCTPGTPNCAITAAPDDSKFIEVHGSRMHYIDTGAGEPILFLHGNPAWSYMWRKVLPLVSPHARCIALDLIGMGLSDKPDIKYTFFDHVKYVEGFVAALGLRNFTMVLHDWGTMIGFYTAMRQDENVTGLAFMEATYKPYPSWSIFDKKIASTFQRMRTPKLGYQMVVVENQIIEKVLPSTSIVPLTEDEINCYRAPFIDPASRRVMLEFANQLPVAGTPPDVVRAVASYGRWLLRSDKPKLLFWATPGLVTTKKELVWAQKNLKNMTSVDLGDGIHLFPESHPTEIGTGLVRWLDKISS